MKDKVTSPHLPWAFDWQFANCLLCKLSKGVDLHIKVNAASTQALRDHMRWHHKRYIGMMGL